MSQKSEKAIELFKQGYNCAQAVLGVFAEEFGLDFNTAMKISSSFGGGMGRMREVCGAVSATFMAAGLVFGSNISKHEIKAAQYKRIQQLAQLFKAKNGSIICRELLAGVNTSSSYLPDERTNEYYSKRPCVELVAQAVEIFEQYLSENSDILNKEQL